MAKINGILNEIPNHRGTRSSVAQNNRNRTRTLKRLVTIENSVMIGKAWYMASVIPISVETIEQLQQDRKTLCLDRKCTLDMKLCAPPTDRSGFGILKIREGIVTQHLKWSQQTLAC